MYGTDTATGAGGLAATGFALTTGSYVLAAVGLILAGVGLYLLLRKESKTRP